MSAMYYAMTKASFEEIALKFVQIDDTHALKTFLEKVRKKNKLYTPFNVKRKEFVYI